MRKQRRQRKIEIFRLEDRVLFEAAGAAEAVEAVENASNPNPDQQNDISESERQEKEAQSVAKYAGPDGAAIQEPGAPVQDQGAGLTRPDAIQQDPAQKLVEGSGDFSDVPDVTQEHTSELSDFLNADFSVTTDSTLSFSDSLSSDSDTHELIVIDSDAAEDLDLDALSDKTEVLVLDNDSDAMEQINAYLDSHDGKYDSIRFVTDGDSGADSAPDHLELNGREVSASDLDAVRDHLADGGDLSVQTALDDAAPVYTLTPDGDFELAHADDLHDAVIHPEIDETITVDASANVPVSALSNPVEEGREELVIINSNIADKDVVLSQLGGRDVLEIDPSQDALSQIQDYLDANPDTRYDAIHILTHGNDQGFYLGSTQVTDAGQMTVFTGHMAENADFMLYGCNLAATERGQALIHEIADVTGCDVAASTDMTGAAAVGGDWVLEYNVGVVETASISLNADWNYRLATITVNSGAAESTTNATSLQSALNGWNNPDNPDQSRAAAIAGDIINIQSQTGGATIRIAITINANAETGGIIVSTGGVILNGTGYTDVTINVNGGIEKSNLTVTGTFTSSGSISESTVNTTQGVIDINGGNVENSTLSASGTGSIDISAGNFSETAVTNSGTGSINISGGTFTESPVAHSGAGSTTITGGEFTGSEKTGTGISISGSGALTIKDNAGSFSGFENAVEFSSSGTATITGGDFTGNVYGLVNNGTMSVSGANVSFTSNHNASGDSAATAGAGILNNASGELSVSGVTIGADGSGNYYGLENHGTITALTLSTIQYNMMSGLRNEGSIDLMSNVKLTGNGFSTDEEKTSYTALGGGLYNSGTIKDFTDIQITENYAAQGGGIYNIGEISAGVNDFSFNIYISKNNATQGGGIYWGGGFLDTSALVYQYGDPDSRGLTGNTAHQGGGVYIASGDVLFQDFRLFENTADRVNLDAATYAGGGLYIASGAKVILDSVTVENNVVENCSNGIDTKYWQYYYNDPDLAIGDTGKTTDKGGRGGGIYSEGTLTVLHSQFNKNVVKFANSSQLPDYYAFLDTLSMGGAIYSSGTLTVYDSYIHNNTAKNGLGGGIYLGGGSATIASTEYYTGESLWQQTGSLNSMIITGNTANGSSDGTQYAAGGFGGGIYSDSSVNLTLDSVTLSGNIATLTVASSSGTSYDIGRGGGLYFGEADAYRTYSAVTSAPVLGNGVLTIDGTVRDLTNGSANVAELEMNRRTSLIFDNHAVSGSGLYINSASTVSIGNTEIYNNATTASPYFTNTNDAQNFFQNFVVSSNQKDASVDIKVEAQDISAAGKLFTSSGIGLYLGGSGATASLDGVSIYGHDVDNAFGGGIYVTGDMYGSGLVHLNLVNTTLYDNTAAYGGGVYIGENASVNILNTTVAGNTAATAGGGVYIIGSNSAVNILNSILVGNTGGDLAAESDAPAMNDMYSLFGSVLVKNSLTLQYEQQSVDPTSCINVKVEDIFADLTLANNWQIQGAQYSKAFTPAGKVYYYDYAYGTTHTLAISAEGAAAYKGVYTAIDLATSVMYFNTLNSQAVAAGQTSGTWMNFSTRTAATVSSDKIVSSSQNGLNRQTGANGSVSYNTYNIGAYQLTVTDVFYYDTPATNVSGGSNRDYTDGYQKFTESGEYYVRPIINTTDDTINPYDGSLSLREAILLAGENLTINYTLDPAIYGENPDAPVISEKFHFGTEIVLSEKIAAGESLEFIIGESNVYGTAADGTSLTSSFYDSIGINKGLTDSFGNDISYRIIAGTVDPDSYNVTPPASSLLPFEYDVTDDATFKSLNLTLKVRDRDPVNNDPGRFRVFDVISGDITLYSEGAGSLTILGGNVSNDNNPDRPASERTDESISNFGGAIRLSGADATLTLNGVTINRGIANRGGAIYVADGTLNLIGTTTINGTVAHGFASAGDNVSQFTYKEDSHTYYYAYTSGYGAGIYMAGGSLVIGMDALSAEKAGEVFYASNVTISGGTAAQYGGGIYLAGDSSLLGNHSRYAYVAGNDGSYSTIDESFTISGNSAVSGAGLYIATTGSVSLERATISGNTLRQGVSSNFKVPTSGIPASYGGGLYVAAGSSVSLKGVAVTGNVTAEYKTPGQGSNPDVPNYVVSYGGGIYAEGTVTISESNLLSSGDGPARDIKNSSISSNTALRGGGVYLADGGTFTMSGADPGNGGDVASVFGNTAISGSYRNEASNTTGQGGGLYVSAGATATLSNVVLFGNTANYVGSENATVNTNGNNLSGRGGAVYTDGVFSLTNTTPSSETLRISMNDNSAAYGGAVYQAGGTVSLSYLSMYGNKASGVTSSSVSAPTGGALYLANGTANILNATISKNIGDAAIYTAAGTLTLTNTTLALNTGSNWGLVNSAATVSLRNTLVIGNGGSGYSNINDDGEYTNDGYSLVGTEENGYSVELIFGTNDFDPATGVIQLNTDQTAENPALTGGYLYRDSAGNAYDQLGNDRTETPGDGVYTIGAAIAGSVSPTTSVLVNTFTDDTTSDNDLYSLREAIQDAAGGNITIAFDLEALQNEMAGGAEASFILDSLLSWEKGTVTIDGNLLASLGPVSITAGTGNADGLFALAGTSGLVLSNFTVSGTGASFSNDGAALSLAGSSTATLTNVTVQNVVTSGNGAVSVANGSSLTLAGNTVFASNQAKNGGALYNAGSLTVSGTLEFTGNQATENGGAIYNAAGTLTVTDAVFSGNTAAGNGGAIYNAAGTLTVTGDFTSNQAENGGAIYNAAGTLTVSDSAVLQGNIATGSGGAIYNAADGTLIAMSAQFSGNHADSGSGGAIYNAGSLTVSGTEFLANESKDGGAIYNEGVLQFTEGTNTVFAGNTATGNGGALYNASSDLQLAYASFTDNQAENGGAFYNAGQNVSVTGVVFGGMSEDGTEEGNTAANGGAIYNAAGAVLTLDAASAFSYNEATGSGGALYNEGALTMSGGSITGNTAANGGAIYHKGTILTVTDAVFSGNAATANGGALYNEGKMTMSGGSFTGNTAANGGAIYNASTESVQFTGTLLTDNIATGNGGAFYNAGQNVSVTGVVFGSMSEDGTEEGNTAANGGAIYNTAGAVLTLDASSAFSYNKATGSGGAISNSGTLSVSASFSDNRAEQNGGAISNSGTLNVRNASFSDNRAEQNGGAIYTDTSVTVNNSVFENNLTSSDGGAISGFNVTVNGGTFTGNHADNGSGGAISGSSLSVSNAAFADNTATHGGAISGSDVTVKGGTFTGNHADNGSGGAISGSSLSVSNAAFADNTATHGGAISGSDVTVKGGTFDRNTAFGNGGAILATGSLSVNSNFTDNEASSNGGAIAAFGAEATISGTFTGNAAYNENGGAVYLDQGGTLANITLTGNTAQDGAAVYSAGGALTMNSATVTDSNAKDGSVVTSRGDKTVIRNSSLNNNTASVNIVNAPEAGELFLISTTVAENSVTEADVSGVDVSIVNSTIAEARKNDVLVQASGDVQIANSIVVGAEAGTTVINAVGDIDGAYSILGQVASSGGTFNNEYGTVRLNQAYSAVFGNNTVNGNGLISLPSGSPAMAGVWTAVDTDSTSDAYGSVYYTTRPDGMWTQDYNPNRMNWNLLGVGSIGGRGNVSPGATVSAGNAGGIYPCIGASWNLAWTPDPGHGLNSDFIKPSENGVAHSIYDIYNAVSDRLYANPGYLLNFRNEVSGASRLGYDFMHEFDDRYRTMGEFSVTIGRFDLGFVPSGENHITVNVKGDVSDDFTRYTTTPYLSDGTPLIPEELKPMNSETETPAAEGTAALPEGLEEKVMAYLGRAEIFKDDFDKALDRLLALNV